MYFPHLFVRWKQVATCQKWGERGTQTLQLKLACLTVDLLSFQHPPTPLNWLIHRRTLYANCVSCVALHVCVRLCAGVRVCVSVSPTLPCQPAARSHRSWGATTFLVGCSISKTLSHTHTYRAKAAQQQQQEEKEIVKQKQQRKWKKPQTTTTAAEAVTKTTTQQQPPPQPLPPPQ